MNNKTEVKCLDIKVLEETVRAVSRTPFLPLRAVLEDPLSRSDSAFVGGRGPQRTTPVREEGLGPGFGRIGGICAVGLVIFLKWLSNAACCILASVTTPILPG